MFYQKGRGVLQSSSDYFKAHDTKPPNTYIRAINE